MIKLKRASDRASSDDGVRFKFRQRYFAELRAHRAAWQPLLAAARRGRVTFVYATHDAARNGAEGGARCGAEAARTHPDDHRLAVPYRPALRRVESREPTTPEGKCVA
jgi:hypothetical protein